MKTNFLVIIFLVIAVSAVTAYITTTLCDENNSIGDSQELKEEINKKKATLDSIRKANNDLMSRMTKDSIEFHARINAINKQITRVTNNAKKINYKHYFVPELDSVGKVLYPDPR